MGLIGGFGGSPLKGFGEQGAFGFGNRRKGEVDAGGLVFGKVEGDDVLAHFEFGDLAPGDHLHVGGGFKERKDLDAERREYDVGMLGAADGDPDAGGGAGGGCHYGKSRRRAG